jgi:hypothetical protein
MQTLRSASVPLLRAAVRPILAAVRPILAAVRPILAACLGCLLVSARADAAAAKPHVVSLGPMKRVPYIPPDATAAEQTEDATTLKVRPLLVDGRQKEWTTGEAHDVTDRSFTIRRVLRLNDALPGESVAHWIWQPGPWLLIDRSTGHVTALHLPDFDPLVSQAVWFRDYAAYCGIATTAKGGLFAIVAQIGARRAILQKQLAKWPEPTHATPVCQPAAWQRQPLRVTLRLTGGDAMVFDVVGLAALIEDGDSDEN